MLEKRVRVLRTLATVLTVGGAVAATTEVAPAAAQEWRGYARAGEYGASGGRNEAYYRAESENIRIGFARLGVRGQRYLSNFNRELGQAEITRDRGMLSARRSYSNDAEMRALQERQVTLNYNSAVDRINTNYQEQLLSLEQSQTNLERQETVNDINTWTNRARTVVGILDALDRD